VEGEKQSRVQETFSFLFVPGTWIFRAETALLDLTIFMLHFVHFFFLFLPWNLIVFCKCQSASTVLRENKKRCFSWSFKKSRVSVGDCKWCHHYGKHYGVSSKRFENRTAIGSSHPASGGIATRIENKMLKTRDH